jgi:hypothetical protein
MKSKDFVSEDFSDLAGALGGISRGLEDNEVLLVLSLNISLNEGGGISNIFSNSGFCLDSDFIFRSFVGSLLDLVVLVSGSGVFMRHDFCCNIETCRALAGFLKG